VDNSGALTIHAERPPDDLYIYQTIASQCVPLVEAKRYRLSARVKLQGFPKAAHANRGELIWYESIDCETGGQFGDFIEPDMVDGWQALIRENLRPALDAKAAKIALVQYGRDSNDGTTYWDDVQFGPTEFLDRGTARNSTISVVAVPGANYIVNGTFNDNLEGWTSGWETAWVARDGVDGSGAIKVTSTSDGSSIGRLGFGQCVNVAPNSLLELGASYRRDPESTQSGSGRLRISWSEYSNCKGRYKIGEWANPVKDREGWQELRVKNLRVNANVRSAYIEAIQSIAAAGIYSSYWDDLYIKVLNEHPE
jgi:hypothetical protein